MSDRRDTLVQGWIDRLHAGDESARDELLAATCDRLTALTRKMLRDYPGVRRWEQTDDVLQNATLRLCRALREVRPTTARAYFRLAALQIRRELLDLARHHYGPEGHAAHHASQADEGASPPVVSSREKADLTHAPDRLQAWAEFHERVEALPDEEREVFDLLWYQELAQPEAADVLGISLATLKRRWMSARLRLQEVLDGGVADGP